jgi:hypothetical protein
MQTGNAVLVLHTSSIVMHIGLHALVRHSYTIHTRLAGHTTYSLTASGAACCSEQHVASAAI